MIVASQWTERRTFLMRLELDAAHFYRDEPIVGIARLKSLSTKEVPLTRLRASLWSIGSDETPHLATELPLIDRSTLAPMETRTVPFALSIPHNLQVGKARIRLTLGGGLWRYVSAPTINVMIAPDRPFSSLVELAAEIARHDVEIWGHVLGRCGYTAVLRPRPELEERIWNISVDIRPEGEGVNGSILIMPNHQDLFAALKSAARIGQFLHHFHTPTLDLEAARPEFERILLPYVNDLQELPIPVDRTESTDHLPIADASE